MEKVIRNGKVAILYSPAYGAGWYTWNEDHPECIFHPKIVEMVESNKRDEITDSFMEELLNTDYFYAGGACDLEIEWIAEGTSFYINEYDGFETILYIDNINLIA
jgi:hypothetical protein